MSNDQWKNIFSEDDQWFRKVIIDKDLSSISNHHFYEQKQEQIEGTHELQNDNELEHDSLPSITDKINTEISVKKTKPIRKKIGKSINKIFAYVSPKRAQKGNKNFIKFLMKQFYAHLPEFKESGSYSSYIEDLQSQIFAQGPKKITLKHLEILVDNKDEKNGYSKINRRILHSIFRNPQILRKDILKSSFIKRMADKKQNLIASKVYGLRCTHKELAKRIQTK